MEKTLHAMHDLNDVVVATVQTCWLLIGQGWLRDFSHWSIDSSPNRPLADLLVLSQLCSCFKFLREVTQLELLLVVVLFSIK